MKSDKSAGKSLGTALIFNVAFMLLTALIVRVGFESNDDPTLSAFVDGQMAQSTVYIPYLNIALGVLLKGIYTLLGRGAAWYTFLQYALLCAGFTALCFVILKRLGLLRGAAVGAVLLLTFGVDVYSIISYTKTAAVCTVGGMALILYAVGQEGKHRLACGLGIGLTVLGFTLRSMEFLPCFGIMAALCLRPLWDLFCSSADAREKSRRLVRLAVPFALAVILSAGLYAVNEWAWSKKPWNTYHSFDRIRVAYADYGRPHYDEMPAVYEALGLTREDVGLLDRSNYFDTEVFSGDVMQAVSDARDAAFPRPTAGECLGLFLDRAIPGFFINLHIYGFLLIMVLWLAAGEHSARDWLCLTAGLGLFALAYLYLIYRGRYLVDRVDLGLLLAAAAIPALMLDPEKLRRERTLTVLVLLFAIGTAHYIMRDYYRTAEAEDKSAVRAAYERLLQDEEHVYLAKVDAVTDGLWSPFEPYGKGYWDKIVLLGGFDILHPTVMDNLALYGVENPYRDCVDNEKVYLLESDIDLTLGHIRAHYDSTACAELVEPLSSETGLDIYRIISRGSAP